MSSSGSYEWDFFVSYTAVDQVWAEWIAWELEEAGHHVLFQAWDFVPGSHWTSRMREGMIGARRTLAVLSPDYLRSVYGQAEWEAAYRADPQGFARKLIPVRVRECDRPDLLGGVVSFDLFDCSADEARRRLHSKIGQALAGRAKPAAAPAFPGFPDTVKPPAAPPSPARPAGTLRSASPPPGTRPSAEAPEEVPPQAGQPTTTPPPADRPAETSPPADPAAAAPPAVAPPVTPPAFPGRHRVAAPRTARSAADQPPSDQTPSELGAVRRLRAFLPIVVLLVVLGIATVAGWYYAKSQYYVGATESGQLAIFRGVPGGPAWLGLSTVVESSSVPLADLTQVAQERVKLGVAADDRADALRILELITADDPSNPNLKPLCGSASTTEVGCR